MRENIYDWTKPNDYRPFKVAKRIWVLARRFGDRKTLDILTNLVSSDAGNLYQAQLMATAHENNVIAKGVGLAAVNTLKGVL